MISTIFVGPASICSSAITFTCIHIQDIINCKMSEEITYASTGSAIMLTDLPHPFGQCNIMCNTL